MIPICLAIAAIIAVLKIAGVAALVSLSWWAITAIALAGFIVPFLFAAAVAAVGGVIAAVVFLVAIIGGLFENLGRRFQ